MGPGGSEIGLAWIIRKPGEGRETWFHNGATGGFRAAMALEPAKGRGVVVLTNAAVEPASDDLALHLLLGAPLQPAGPVPSAPMRSVHSAVTLSPAELDRLVGRYELAPNLALTIERDGAGLKARMGDQPAYPVYPEAPLSIFWRVVDAEARFTAGPDGTVTGVVFQQNGQQMNGKRVAP
jgi:hypothetical protein